MYNSTDNANSAGAVGYSPDLHIHDPNAPDGPTLPLLSTEDEPIKGENSVSAAVFSFCCTTVGAGIVSLPAAVAKGGFLSLILVVLVSIMANYTAKRLVAALHMVPGKRITSYADLGAEVLGPWGHTLVCIFQVATLFGVCTIFLILIGHNMNALVDNLTYHDWVLVFGAVLIPVSWLKTMKEISWLATFGILASIYVGAVVTIKGFHRATTAEHIHYDVFRINGISVAFNVIVFSFGGTSVLPSIEAEMKEPAKFPRVANYSYLLIGGVYALVSAGGYAGYGSTVGQDALSSLGASGIAKSARALIVAHVFLAYPIPLYPMNRYLEHWLGFSKLPPDREIVYRIGLRSTMVLLTILVASVVPYFGDVLSLVSALSVILMVFVFPLWFYWVLSERHNPGRMPTSERIIVVFIMVVGVIGTGVGLYYGVKDLIHDIHKHPHPFAHFFHN